MFLNYSNFMNVLATDYNIVYGGTLYYETSIECMITDWKHSLTMMSVVTSVGTF